METLFNGFTLEIAPGTFPLSTDSIALADFVRLPASARVLDLGSGCGTLGLLLCARQNDCAVTGIELDENLSPAEKLKVVQKLMAEGDERAAKIYETIGAYFGYAVAYYAIFYDIKHVLIMGRVTSGEGGVILLERAQEVLDKEFPELAAKIKLHIPDENSRRVGQSVAAASLPKLK